VPDLACLNINSQPVPAVPTEAAKDEKKDGAAVEAK